MTDISYLDQHHAQAFKNAATNLLSTEIAELTYAQILEGLPTEQVVIDGYTFMEDHPVFTLKRETVSGAFIQKARDFRSRLDLSHLAFEANVSGMGC